MQNISLSPGLTMIISALFLVVSVFYFWKSQQLKSELKRQGVTEKKQRDELSHKMYELASPQHLSGNL